LVVTEPTLRHLARDSSFVRAITIDTQLIFLDVAVWRILVLVARRLEVDADRTTVEQVDAFNIQSNSVLQPERELNSLAYKRVPRHLPVVSAPTVPVRTVVRFPGVVGVHIVGITAVAVVGVGPFSSDGIYCTIVVQDVIEHGSFGVSTGGVGGRHDRRVSWATVALRFLRGYSKATNGDAISIVVSRAVVGEGHESFVIFTVRATVYPGMLSPLFGSESLRSISSANLLATNDLLRGRRGE
jgi:hypothetical protein